MVLKGEEAEEIVWGKPRGEEVVEEVRPPARATAEVT